MQLSTSKSSSTYTGKGDSGSNVKKATAPAPPAAKRRRRSPTPDMVIDNDTTNDDNLLASPAASTTSGRPLRLHIAARQAQDSAAAQAETLESYQVSLNKFDYCAQSIERKRHCEECKAEEHIAEE